MAGRAGGQTITGGTGASENLVLRSTSNGTKGKISIDETTESSSITTGSLIVSGGVGIAKKLYIGGASNIAGITTISNTTQTTLYNNGALVVSGGVGISKDCIILGNLYPNNNIYMTDINSSRIYGSYDTPTADLRLNSTGHATKGRVLIDETTDSSSISTGAIVILGGMGIVKKLYVGGDLSSAGSVSVAGYSQNPIKARHYWRNTNSGASMTSGTYYPDTNGYVLTTEVGDLIEAFFNITCYLSTTGIARYIEAEIFVDDAIKCNGIDEIADTATGSDDFGNACCHLYWIATGTSHTIKYKFSSQATCKSFNGGINVGLIHYKGSTNVSVVEASI